MTSEKRAEPVSARHSTDYLSLIFGLIFLVVAGWWAASYYLDFVITWDLPDTGWVLAGGLILLGLVGILASLRRDRPAAETAASPAARSAGHPGSSSTLTDSRPAAGTFGLAPPAPADGPTADLDRPAGNGERGADPTDGDRGADLTAGGWDADRDRPAAGDPGGHRPAAGDPGGHRPE